MAQIRSMFHPLSGQPLDPVDGRVRRLRVRAVVRGVGVHGPARVGGVRVDAPGARGGRVQARGHGAARVRVHGESQGPARGGRRGELAVDVREDARVVRVRPGLREGVRGVPRVRVGQPAPVRRVGAVPADEEAPAEVQAAAGRVRGAVAEDPARGVRDPVRLSTTYFLIQVISLIPFKNIPIEIISYITNILAVIATIMFFIRATIRQRRYQSAVKEEDLENSSINAELEAKRMFEQKNWNLTILESFRSLELVINKKLIDFGIDSKRLPMSRTLDLLVRNGVLNLEDFQKN